MSEAQDRLGKIVAAYKIVLGMQRDTERWKAWDRHNYARNAKAAKSVLEAFEGDLLRSVAWVIFQGNEWKDAGLSFTLETISRHAWDRGTQFDGQKASAVGDLGLLGFSGDSETARPGIESKPPEENMGAGPLSNDVAGLVRSVSARTFLGPKPKVQRNGKGTANEQIQPRDLPVMGEDLGPLGSDVGESRLPS